MTRTDDPALAPMRRTATATLLAIMAMSAGLIPLAGVAVGSRHTLAATLLGVAALILPLAGRRAGRPDAELRWLLGPAVVTYPALFTLLFADHPWQIDMHMSFFVALSTLVLLCDWRPIVAAAALTALHHLLLELTLPGWVFPGSGSIARVLLHGGLVVLQAMVLIQFGQVVARLTRDNAAAAAAAEQARGEAVAAQAEAERLRTAAEQALANTQHAQAETERARAHRQALEETQERALAARRREIADAIEVGIGSLTADLGRTATELAAQGEQLTGSAAALLRGAETLSHASGAAVRTVGGVAVSAADLTRSIHRVDESARAAEAVARVTAAAVERLPQGLHGLAGEVAAARDTLEHVGRIAAQSNLLALNATIEAARGAAASSGFAVVAREMKAMATETAHTSATIADRLERIGGAAQDFAGAIAAAGARAGEITEAASGIAREVQDQRMATEAIAGAAARVMADAEATDAHSQAIGAAASENEAIAARTIAIAHVLRDRSADLGTRFETLLAGLRAA